MSNTMTSGANALKLENEVLSEAETSSSDLVDAHVLKHRGYWHQSQN